MLQKINAWWQKPLSLLLITNVLMAVLMPFIFKLVHLSIAWRVGLLFLILDGAYAWWIGRTIKRNGLGWWWLLIFPLLFAGMVFLRFAKYDYWFVPIYIVMSLLALAKD